MKARQIMIDKKTAAGFPPPSSLRQEVRNTYKNGHTGDQVWKYIYEGAQRTNKEIDNKLGIENNLVPRRRR